MYFFFIRAPAVWITAVTRRGRELVRCWMVGWRISSRAALTRHHSTSALALAGGGGGGGGGANNDEDADRSYPIICFIGLRWCQIPTEPRRVRVRLPKFSGQLFCRGASTLGTKTNFYNNRFRLRNMVRIRFSPKCLGLRNLVFMMVLHRSLAVPLTKEPGQEARKRRSDHPLYGRIPDGAGVRVDNASEPFDEYTRTKSLLPAYYP